MSINKYLNIKVKDEYINKLQNNFLLANKFNVDCNINISQNIKINFIYEISEELAQLIKKVSFECASCGGPDKARVKIEMKLRNDNSAWYLDNIIGCSIAYKQFNTPWNAIKKDNFTRDLLEKVEEFLTAFLEI
jgi:hypothetical protein